MAAVAKAAEIQHGYSDVVERAAKTQIRKHFIREGTERRREAKTTDNYYHACLYDLLQ